MTTKAHISTLAHISLKNCQSLFR